MADEEPVWWGEKRFVATLTSEGMKIKPYPHTISRFFVLRPNGVSYKQQGVEVSRTACNEYVVWAKDELDAFVKVNKMRRGEGGDPFGKSNIFDD